MIVAPPPRSKSLRSYESLYRARIQILTVLDDTERDVRSRTVIILNIILVNSGLDFIINDLKGFPGRGIIFLLEIIL